MWERQLRAVLCWAVFFVMIAFYLPVVAAIQALLQVRLSSMSGSMSDASFRLCVRQYVVFGQSHRKAMGRLCKER